jgi:hypothetical protein
MELSIFQSGLNHSSFFVEKKEANIADHNQMATNQAYTGHKGRFSSQQQT